MQMIDNILLVGVAKMFGMAPVKFLVGFIYGGAVMAVGSPVDVVKAGDSFLQYGALGILFVAVILLFWYIGKLTDMHKAERKELVKSLREVQISRSEDSAALNKTLRVLGEALSDRPCILNDKRTQL